MMVAPQLVIGGDAEAALRSVGPWPWVVLQALALRAEPDAADGLVARVSARRLAAELGAARATIDRAVDALSTAGWVSPCSWRDPIGGRFVSQHQLSLPAGLHRADLADRGLPPGAAVPPGRVPRRRPSATAPSTTIAVQLSLLDLDTAAD